jgi:hypothetical protein
MKMIDDNGLENFLIAFASTPNKDENEKDGRNNVNLSFQHLTRHSIPMLVRWLRDYTGNPPSICVKGNWFSFDDFYSELSALNALDFISNRRLTMSSTEQEWRMECLALEAKKNDRILQLSEVIKETSQVVKETDQKLASRIDAFGEFVLRFGEKLDKEHEERKARDDEYFRKLAEERAKEREEFDRKMAKEREEYDQKRAKDREEFDRKYVNNQTGIKRIEGWRRNYTSAFETVVGAVLREWLYKQGYRDIDELTEQMHQIPTTKITPKGTEWDGVIWCRHISDADADADTNKWHLFLVEAKTNMLMKYITEKPEAVETTLDFIAKAHSGDIQRNTKNNTKVIQTAACWAVYHNMEVHVVFGAHAFDMAMIAEIEKHRYIRICLNDDLYHVFDEDGKQSELTYQDIEHDFW